MPYVVDDTAIKLTASVGAAVYPVDGNKLDDLIRASDRAMYRSKALSAISSTSFNTPHGDRAVNTDTGQQWQLDRVPRAT
jgi:GGDEF domain-containing protein